MGKFQTILYFLTLGMGTCSLVILYFQLYKRAEKLPESWKKSFPSKNFRMGILFLMIYILLIFICESISFYLAAHRIYNSFMISIGFTLYTPFLFGFLFIHTQTAWKRYGSVLLYLILVGYFAIGGYYHPDCILPESSALLFSSIFFLVALMHLTDLLVNPKSEHFKFQLKVDISILIYNLLSAITTSFFWSYTDKSLPYFGLISDINFYVAILYYLSLNLIFINEILKLRRNYSNPMSKA